MAGSGINGIIKKQIYVMYELLDDVIFIFQD